MRENVHRVLIDEWNSQQEFRECLRNHSWISALGI